MLRMSFILIAYLLTAQTAWATNVYFTQFIIKNAHDHGFNKCDNAIESVFNDIIGPNINVVYANGLSPDSLKIIVTSGTKTAPAYAEAEFREARPKCKVTYTNVISQEMGCSEMVKQSVFFKYVSETQGVIHTKSSSGNTAMFMRAGSSRCIMVQSYQSEG